MRILVVDTYYPIFLRSFFGKNPHLKYCPYFQQWRALMDENFGTADYFSKNLQKLGHEATEVVWNCSPLQLQWAQEHALSIGYQFSWIKYHGIPFPWIEKDWQYKILIAQIKSYRPDVVHIQDPLNTDPSFLREIRPYVNVITAQIASFIPNRNRIDFRGYDLVLSSLPNIVKRFRNQGISSDLFRLGFEHTVLKNLTKISNGHSVVHIGGYGPIHRERNELLEKLIQLEVPLLCWGYGNDHLSLNSPIRLRYKGEAWGLEMHNIRHNSSIVVSKHITTVASEYANIMTLFEATGVGSMLIIDKRKDLDQLFEPGKEVIVYESAEECAELINYYLENNEERSAVAISGQERTLREHTYYQRMQEYIGLVTPFLN